jgi:hypothetical protein
MDFLMGFTPVELNSGEDRLTAQLKAAFDPPKTLEDLQQTPIENVLGYEQHHIVEQNPGNVLKINIEKFGQELLDDSGNLTWVPRFKHEEITAYYNENLAGPGSPTVRDLIGKFGMEQQRQIGLYVLRKYGVLK